MATIGFALSWSGFVPNVDQTPAVIWTMKALFAGTPFVMLLIGARVLGRYALDEREHERIRAGLVAARGAEVRAPERVVPSPAPGGEPR